MRKQQKIGDNVYYKIMIIKIMCYWHRNKQDDQKKSKIQKTDPCMKALDIMLGTALPGFRNCNPSWLRVSKKTVGP